MKQSALAPTSRIKQGDQMARERIFNTQYCPAAKTAKKRRKRPKSGAKMQNGRNPEKWRRNFDEKESRSLIGKVKKPEYKITPNRIMSGGK